MKIPAVAIAAAFAGGILLGLHGFHEVSRRMLVLLICCCVATLVLGFISCTKNHLRIAAIGSLIAWVELGLIAGCLAQPVLPADHVLNRIARGEINAKSPLRWHGRVSNEPARLPWGYSFDVALSGVDAAGEFLPVCGGMRLGFTPKEEDPPLAEVHVGYEVSAITLAHLPILYRDPGAFDRREFLAKQNIDVVGTLRASKLLTVETIPRPRITERVARWRERLRERVDLLCPDSPQTASGLRAMLLGDRTFLDRAESVDFQKTGAFHVLVVAGLHIGALAFFLNWLFRRMRIPHGLATSLLIASLFGYIAVVEQRTPVLRAGLMITIVVVGGFFYRRLDLLNSTALAALILLVAKPGVVHDSGFQLSFLAIGCIAGLALPWIEHHIEPYRHALRGWQDSTRDISFKPRFVQFRLDLRSACRLVSSRLTGRIAKWTEVGLIQIIGGWFWVAELVVVSLVLQFGMLPLMARDFHRVPLAGPLANLCAVPLTGIIVPLGFFSLGGSFVLMSMGRLIAIPLTWLVGLQGHIVSGLAHMPGSSYRVPTPPIGVFVLFFASAVFLATGHRMVSVHGQRLKTLAGIGVLVAAVLIVSYPFAPIVVANALEVTVLDVAQGDSILVVSPRGSTLLIDGGGAFEGFPGRPEHSGADPGEEVVSAYLWSRGFKKLNAVAVTHAHQDHIGGLSAVLQNFSVGQVWMGNDNASPALARFKSIVQMVHVPLAHEIRGQSFMWDGVQVDFLWPDSAADPDAPSAKNNDSLVVRLRYGDRTILLPGDAEKQAEYEMLSENEAAGLHADVLKVGHHGSKNSTMSEFLAAVSPQIGIISAGEQNPYGHPSAELLGRLKESGVRILRTDEVGAIQVRTDGHDLKVSCFVACPMP